jgi:hypothetical protein
MHLHDALEQITEIRQTVARAATFRGYRSGPVAISALLAWGCAAGQAMWIRQPAEQFSAWLSLWLVAAGVSIAVGGASLLRGVWLGRSRMHRDMTLLAVEKLVPCMIAGGILTWALAARGDQVVWLLPGLWSILFGLGVFASWRMLPKATFWVGGHYLVTGAICLMLGHGDQALAPWTMMISFGLGQTLAAAVLYWTLEHNIE